MVSLSEAVSNLGQRSLVPLRDVATRLSRIELVLAFLAAAILGGLLSGCQEWLQPGVASKPVRWMTVGLAVALCLVGLSWILARAVSLDFGACIVIRRGRLLGREQVSDALKRSSRDWVAFELQDNLSAWSSGPPATVVELTHALVRPLGTSVGRPRVLLAVSSSDAIGFFIGQALRPGLVGVSVDVATLPTGSHSWGARRYRVGSREHRALFDREEMTGTSCKCQSPRGVGVVDPLRSPNRNYELVVGSLTNQEVVCCSGAIHLIPSRGRDAVPITQQQTIDATRFVRARSRWLMDVRGEREVDIALTVGPEASLIAGLLLWGYSDWHLWEYDKSSSRWVTRWKSG